MVELTFQKNEDGKYIGTFTSSGNIASVHLLRYKAGNLCFYASVGDLPPVRLYEFSKSVAGSNFIRAVSVPNGTTVTIESDSLIKKAYYTE